MTSPRRSRRPSRPRRAGSAPICSKLTAPLPAALRQEIVELWDAYEAAATPEARLAKGLDKLETILQHTQGRNPADFDYAFQPRLRPTLHRRGSGPCRAPRPPG